MNLLQSKIVRDESLTNYDIATLCFIKMCSYVPSCHNILLSSQSIVLQMYDTLDINRGIYNKVIESISNLIDSGYLKADKLNNLLYKIDVSQFKYSSEWLPCVKYEEDDLRRIMQNNKHPADILRYYLYLLSTINRKIGYGFWSIKKLAEELDCSEQTLVKYNKILEDMKLIYIYHSKNKDVSNTYGYYENKDIIYKAGEERCRESANYKRRMTQLANQIREGRIYDESVMEEVRQYCETKGLDILHTTN